MHLTVYLAMFGIIPAVLMLYSYLPSRKAFLISMVGSWLFLPFVIFKLKVIPEYSKMTAGAFACLLGTILFDWQRLATFKFRWFDIPMLCWCLTPFVTSVQNDLGWYDGVSAVIGNIVVWGFPYFLGRIYFPDWSSFRDLGVAIFIGGLICIPLCWIEIRMSPQVHKWIYGFHPHAFSQNYRFGGYRPVLFMQHGLAVGMWMTSASLVGVWLWQTGSLKRVFNVPMSILVPVLLFTTLMCKNTAGLMFLMSGIAILYSIRWTKMPVLLLFVMAIAPIYMYMRASGEWTGEWAVNTSERVFGKDRSQSLNTRIQAENLLSEKALQQPWFGWGRWSRNRVYDRLGKDAATTDGLWVIVLGVDGIVGLIAFTTAVLLPPLLVWYRCPLRMWSHPGIAAAVAMAVLLSLYMLDNILNAMADPIFMMALGGLAGIGPSIRAQLRNGARAPGNTMSAVSLPGYASPRPASRQNIPAFR